MTRLASQTFKADGRTLFRSSANDDIPTYHRLRDIGRSFGKLPDRPGAISCNYLLCDSEPTDVAGDNSDLLVTIGMFQVPKPRTVKNVSPLTDTGATTTVRPRLFDVTLEMASMSPNLELSDALVNTSPTAVV